MTDKELIQAYRECAEHLGCVGCRFETGQDDDCAAIGHFLPDNLVNRLEALLAENEHLREVTKMVPKWVSVSERLPEEYRDEYGELKCFLVCVENGGEPFRGVYDGKHWGDGWNVLDVTHWMPLPNRPALRGWSDGMDAL